MNLQTIPKQFIFFIFALFGGLSVLVSETFFKNLDGHFSTYIGLTLSSLIVFLYLLYCNFKLKSKQLVPVDIDFYIDSVYYLGFIFTLLYLIVSFSLIDSGAQAMTDQALSAILSNFGRGLLTTFLGLVGRIYLLGVATPKVDDVKDVAENFHSVVQSLSDDISFFRRTISDACSESEKSLDEFNYNLKKTTHEFNKSFDTGLNAVSTTIHEVQSNLDEDLNSFTAAIRLSLDQVEKNIKVIVTQFESDMRVISNTVSTSTNSISNALVDNEKAINDTLFLNATKLSDVKNLLDALAQSTKVICNEIDDGYKKIANNLGEVSNLTIDPLQKLSLSITGFSNNLSKASESLVIGLDRYAGSLVKIDGATTSYEVAVSKAAAGLKEISESSKRFNEELISTAKLIQDYVNAEARQK